jgi:fructose-bisphosphate aldolase, class II
MIGGFVNTKDMFQRAYEGRYAVPAFNFVCLEQLLAITDACLETRSPFILQCSANVRRGIGPAMVRAMAAGCAQMVAESGTRLPSALHLDHGTGLEECEAAIRDGFSSVMIDGSALPYEENVRVSAQVSEVAHDHGVTVEAELGVLCGAEEDTVHGESAATDPARVPDFVMRTGVDSLAVSIGTSHGVVKMRPRPGGGLPSLRFDILARIEEALPGFPIVLHGASGILHEYVDLLNLHGGALAEAQGVPEEQVRRAVASAVRKVNIASDGWIAMTAAVRRALAEDPASIDPRSFLSPARREMRDVYVRKIRDVMGSAGKAGI